MGSPWLAAALLAAAALVVWWRQPARLRPSAGVSARRARYGPVAGRCRTQAGLLAVGGGEGGGVAGRCGGPQGLQWFDHVDVLIVSKSARSVQIAGRARVSPRSEPGGNSAGRVRYQAIMSSTVPPAAGRRRGLDHGLHGLHMLAHALQAGAALGDNVALREGRPDGGRPGQGGGAERQWRQGNPHPAPPCRLAMVRPWHACPPS